ncbi:MAG: hypothetical protein ABI863_05410 [Ginsengibacter sp.]
MNKRLFLMGFVILFACAAFAQDSTINNTTKHHHAATHKKSMHNSTSTMPADSVNAGKITTNPNGKMSTRKKQRSVSSADSTR